MSDTRKKESAVASPVARIKAIFDVEVTNRCNAHCVMCPREKTPAQGLMDEAVFRQTVARAVEYGRVESFVIGGLGEPLVHPAIVNFVRIAAQAGLRPSIITNAALLTKEKSQALIEAGLNNLNVSIGGLTPETYESVQRGLRWRQTYTNVLNFLDLAAGKASVNLQISPTEQTYLEAGGIAKYWRKLGVRLCLIFPFASSRGGSLDSGLAERKHCPVRRLNNLPAGTLNIETVFRPTKRDAATLHRQADFVCYPKDRITFVSWQGNYHLCCNDYEKRHVIGNVRDMSVSEAYRRKAELGRTNLKLCEECDFSGGDLPARDAGFYLRMLAYLLKGAAGAVGAGRRRRAELSRLQKEDSPNARRP
jgi:MoaA/NifB/PqqE/SkfB family radical SAM enzyme